MGKLFRKLSALVFSVIPFSACQAEKDAAHFSVMSNQDNAQGEKMLLGTWVAYCNMNAGRLSMEEQTARFKDAGLNFIIYGAWINDDKEPVKRNLSDVNWWKHVDSVMGRYGMKYLFGSAAAGANTIANVPGSIENNLKEEAVRNAENIVPQLQNCNGFVVLDEPRGSQLGLVGKACREYAGIKKGIYPFVNLFPSVVAGLIGWEGICGSYQNYFEEFIASAGKENLEYISHDSYPFNADSTDFSFYNDLEVMRKTGLKYGLKTHGFPQLCAWEGKRMPNINEVRWNCYSYLAYGFKALTYFNYTMWMGENCFDGLIDNQTGEVRHPELWEEVKKLNYQMLAASDIILNVDCILAGHTTLDNIPGFMAGSSIEQPRVVSELPEHSLISAPEGADLIISYFKAKDNSEPYVMLFNKSFDKTVDNMTFTLDKNGGIAYLEAFIPDNKQYERIEIINNSFNYSLDQGEGVFIRLGGDIDIDKYSAP